MRAMASQITSLMIVYSTIYSGADQRKHQGSACVTGLCEGNSPVTGEFPSQRASNMENASLWWCHHEILERLQKKRKNVDRWTMYNGWTMDGSASHKLCWLCQQRSWKSCSSYCHQMSIHCSVIYWWELQQSAYNFHIHCHLQSLEKYTMQYWPGYFSFGPPKLLNLKQQCYRSISMTLQATTFRQLHC